MKRLVLILRKVAKFVFRLISSRLSSRGAAGTISKLLETKFVSKLLENAVKICLSLRAALELEWASLQLTN